VSQNDRELNLTIRRTIDAYAGLKIEARRIRDTDDLFALGLTCFAAIDLLLALEIACGVSFPQHLLSRSSVASIAVIEERVGQARGALRAA
jgi:acyl carrier protein